jgi:8-oxo-dGTP pyrophosphatase MutT (NUDIX family)
LRECFAGAEDVDQVADAAVLIPITRETEPQIILTVRAGHLSSHAGEVAFPGGRRDPGDHSLSETALRESFEEIALDPGAVEVLGPGRQRRSRFGLQVRPYIGIVAPDPVLVPNPEEIEAVFRVPLRFFLERANLRIEAVKHEGRIRDVPWYPWHEKQVWGLTAVMLIDMLNIAFDFGVDIRR